MIDAKPLVVVFAGPNGSGKSTVTKWAQISGVYINADDIKKSEEISDLSAAQKAEELRERCVCDKKDFTFETVLSTPRNINLLRRAKDEGFFIKSVFVLTNNPKINILRVENRVEKGGHGVPRDKIKSRYYRSLKMLPLLVELSDICHVYDNSENNRCFFRIFKKKTASTSAGKIASGKRRRSAVSQAFQLTCCNSLPFPSMNLKLPALSNTQEECSSTAETRSCISRVWHGSASRDPLFQSVNQLSHD